MNENEISHLPSESNLIPPEVKNDETYGHDKETEPPTQFFNDSQDTKEGLTFNWFDLLIGVGIFLWFSGPDSIFSDDFTAYPFLAIAVIIHELGHVIIGKSFGCLIQKMQVFFMSFISYKPKPNPDANSWRNITWSLGVLPLGGVTVFKSRQRGLTNHMDDMETDIQERETATASSPYIEDKPAWQRLLISAAGVLFNIATFLILYLAMPYMPDECFDFLWPLTAFSLILGLLNILPVYPLDGGAIVFALYEIITGKKPSPGFTKVCSWIGFIFIVLFFWVFPGWLGDILGSIFRLLF